MSEPRLTTLRDHFLQMAQSQHLMDCPSVTAREPFWQTWADIRDEAGQVVGLRWLGPRPKWEPPYCDGCLSDYDRAWFARLADEIEVHIGHQETLL